MEKYLADMWIYICRKKFLSKYEVDFAIMNEGCKTPRHYGQGPLP